MVNYIISLRVLQLISIRADAAPADAAATRSRSRSRSPVKRKSRSRSRSPAKRSRDRSPVKRERSPSPKRRSRSPVKRQSPKRSRSRSRGRDRRSSRSRSRSGGRGGGGGAGEVSGVAGRWNASRGFGFIKLDNGDDIFCHFSAIKDGNMLEEGKKVTLRISYDDRRGKDRAEDVYGGITSDRDTAPRVGICFDYRDGRCSYGDRCKFLHEGPSRGGGGGGRDYDRGYDRGGRDYDRGGRDYDRGGYDRGGRDYDRRDRGGYDDRRY